MMLGGCAPAGTEKNSDTDVEEGKVQIGVTFDSLVIERWQRERDIFVSTAENLGAEVAMRIANGSVEEQMLQIEEFIKQKMDVIVVIAVETDGITKTVKKAKEAGIKVIAYDRIIENADADLYISFDNEEVGRLMAEALIENVPAGGTIAAVFGPKTDNNAVLVESGFQEVISGSSLQVIYTAYADKWLAEQASDAVENALAAAGEFGGMLCGNDDLASYAIRTLSEHRLAGKVCVVGQDADLGACQRIVEGTQTMTVYKPVDRLAKKAAEYAVMLGEGRKMHTEGTFFDGKYDVPYENLAPVAVTKDNIEEVIIDGGFHKREEVYLNVTGTE